MRCPVRAFRHLFMCLTLMACWPASPAQLRVDTDGVLLGARDVVVRGGHYDVEFRTGTCIEVFSGCDSTASLPFNDDYYFSAEAGWAVLNQVLLDGPQGNFDTEPWRVIHDGGLIRVPIYVDKYGEFSPTQWFVAAYSIINDSIPDIENYVYDYVYEENYFDAFAKFTWTLWSRHEVQVAAPSGVVCMITVLCLLPWGRGASRRQRPHIARPRTFKS